MDPNNGPPHYDDGPRKPSESKEEYQQRVAAARQAMGIQLRPRFRIDLPQRRDDEDAAHHRQRLNNWRDLRRQEERDHQEQIDPNHPNYDPLYEQAFRDDRDRRNQHNARARADAFQRRQAYDLANGLPLSPLPTYPLDEEGDGLYDPGELLEFNEAYFTGQRPSPRRTQQQAQERERHQRSIQRTQAAPQAATTRRPPSSRIAASGRPASTSISAIGSTPIASSIPVASSIPAASSAPVASSTPTGSVQNNPNASPAGKYWCCKLCAEQKKGCSAMRGNFPCQRCTHLRRGAQCVRGTAILKRETASTPQMMGIITGTSVLSASSIPAARGVAPQSSGPSASLPGRPSAFPLGGQSQTPSDQRAPRPGETGNDGGNVSAPSGSASTSALGRTPGAVVPLGMPGIASQSRYADPSALPRIENVPAIYRDAERQRRQRQSLPTDPPRYGTIPRAFKCGPCTRTGNSNDECGLAETGYPCRQCVVLNISCEVRGPGNYRPGRPRTARQVAINVAPATAPAPAPSRPPARASQGPRLPRSGPVDSRGVPQKAPRGAAAADSGGSRGRDDNITASTNRRRSASPLQSLTRGSIFCRNCRQNGRICSRNRPCQSCIDAGQAASCDGPDIQYGDRRRPPPSDDDDDDYFDDDDDFDNDDRYDRDMAAATRASRRQHERERAGERQRNGFQDDLDQAMSGPSGTYSRPAGLPSLGTFAGQEGQSYSSEVAVPDYMTDPWLRPQGDPWLNSSFPIPQMADAALAPVDATHGFGGASEDLAERAMQEMYNAAHGSNWMGEEMDGYEETPVEENDLGAFAPPLFDIRSTFATLSDVSTRARQEAIAAANSANSFIRPRTAEQGQYQGLSDRVTLNYEDLPANPESAPPAAATLQGFHQIHNWQETQHLIPMFAQLNQCTEMVNYFWPDQPNYRTPPICRIAHAGDCELLTHGFVDAATCTQCHHLQNQCLREQQHAAMEDTKGYVCQGCAYKIRRLDPRTGRRLGYKDNCLCNAQIRKSWVCHEHREAGIAELQTYANLAREWAIRLGQGNDYCIGCYKNRPDPTSATWGCFVCREWAYRGL